MPTASPFGDHIRKARIALFAQDKGYSLRRLAARLGMQPSYLSRLERGAPPRLSEAHILGLARELHLDADRLLALAGKIPPDVRRILLDRPETFASLLRSLAGCSDADVTACRNFGLCIDTFRETQHLANVGSFTRDLVAGNDFWSEEFYHIFGLPADQPTPTFEQFLALVHPEDQPLLQTIRRKALAGSELQHYSYRFRRGDGAWRYAKAVVRTKYDDQGQATLLLGTVQDVTTERQALEDLRSVARFPEDNPNPVLRIARDGLLTYANSAAGLLLDSLGITVGQYVGWPLAEALGRALDLEQDQALDIPVADSILHFVIVPLPASGYANLYGRDVTEARTASRALTQAQARVEELTRNSLDRQMLETLLETTSDTVVFVGKDGRVLRTNASFARTLGQHYGGTPEKLVGRHVSEIFDAATLQKIAARDAAIVLSGRPRQDPAPMIFTAGDGAERQLHATRAPLRDTSGAVIGLCAVGRDITDWRQTADALALSEARYRRLFNDAILGAFRTTTAGRILAVNPALARAFGYDTPEEMLAAIGDNARLAFKQPWRRVEVMRRLANEERVVNVENVYLRKDGSTFIGNLHARLTLNEDGEAVVEGFIEDITARKQAEAEQLASEERLKTHLRNFPLPTLTFRLCNRELVLCDANKAAEALFKGRICTCLHAPAGAIFEEAPEVYLTLWSAFEGRRFERRRLSFRPPGAGEPGLFNMTFVFAAPDTVMLHAEAVTLQKSWSEARRPAGETPQNS